MAKTNNYYPAKLLLFGEYTILQDSDALAIPLNKYSGQWQAVDRKPYPFSIKKLVSYWQAEKVALDFEQIELDFKANVWFSSDIPIGSGLGSSGALIAGFYDKYHLGKSSSNEALIQLLAGMENFFHGKSSGMDPLISLKKQALVKNKNVVKLVAESNLFGLPAVYLIPTNKQRNTQKLVQLYDNKFERLDFKSDVDRLSSLVHSSIQLSQKLDKVECLNSINNISHLQWDNFQEMIVDEIKNTWKESLNSDSYAIKLCGAGGGGFYLAFGKLPEHIERQAIAIC